MFGRTAFRYDLLGARHSSGTIFMVLTKTRHWSGALMGANLHLDLTLRSTAERCVSKGRQLGRRCKPAISTTPCVAHPSRRPLRGLLRMRLSFEISAKLAPMSG